jgi:hypothetical protein
MCLPSVYPWCTTAHQNHIISFHHVRVVLLNLPCLEAGRNKLFSHRSVKFSSGMPFIRSANTNSPYRCSGDDCQCPLEARNSERAPFAESLGALALMMPKTNSLSLTFLSTRFRRVILLKFCWPSPTLVLHMVLVLTDVRRSTAQLVLAKSLLIVSPPLPIVGNIRQAGLSVTRLLLGIFHARVLPGSHVGTCLLTRQLFGAGTRSFKGYRPILPCRSCACVLVPTAFTVCLRTISSCGDDPMATTAHYHQSYD